MRIYLNDHVHARPRDNTLPKVVCEGPDFYTYSRKVEIWLDGTIVATVETGKFAGKNHEVLAWVQVHNGKVVPK